MYPEIFLIIFMFSVNYAVTSERYISYCNVEKIIRIFCSFIAVYRYVRFLLKLSRYSSRYAVQFNSVQFRLLHAFRKYSEKVSWSA